MRILTTAVLAGAFLVGTACAAQSRSEQRAAAELPPQALSAYAGRPVLLLPVRFLRSGDSLGWAGAVADQRALLRELDEAISAELDERGLAGTWILPERLMRSVRRNPTYATDPYGLAAAPLRPTRRRPERLADPLAGQLRTLIALTDARYVLYPVELRFEPHEGMGRAALHMAIIDARLAEVVWMGQVAGEATAERTAESVASLAARFADLFVAP